MAKLEIKSLSAEVEGKAIFEDLNLVVNSGEKHVIMGPNGAGKSTLGNVIMGHPKYDAKGEALLDGKNILGLEPEERAAKGLFLSFQYPMEIEGVTIANFLRTALNENRPSEKKVSVFKFQEILKEKMLELNIPEEFAGRFVNQGFSGGEKKRCEILQMSILEPKVAILDETDSGLDVDSMKIVAENINKIHAKTKCSIIMITHHKNILKYFKPDFIHIFIGGKIVKSGGIELAEILEEKGYAAFQPLKLHLE